jgi:hypothetical protein
LAVKYNTNNLITNGDKTGPMFKLDIGRIAEHYYPELNLQPCLIRELSNMIERLFIMARHWPQGPDNFKKFQSALALTVSINVVRGARAVLANYFAQIRGESPESDLGLLISIGNIQICMQDRMALEIVKLSNYPLIIFMAAAVELMVRRILGKLKKWATTKTLRRKHLLFFITDDISGLFEPLLRR